MLGKALRKFEQIIAHVDTGKKSNIRWPAFTTSLDASREPYQQVAELRGHGCKVELRSDTPELTPFF